MRPLKWFKKRAAARMPLSAELIMDMLVQHNGISIMAAISLSVDTHKITSRSTAHSSLMWLREHGYLTIKDGKDNRQKFYSLTSKAHRYLGITEGNMK